MSWTINYTDYAKRQLVKLDKQQARRIINYLKETVAVSDPRSHGKALTGTLTGIWSYRVGDYRVLADIQDNALVILVVGASHRKDVYGGH